MKHLRLFIAFALFNSLAIDASTNHRDDILAGQSKKDTLAIINSYLESEYENKCYYQEEIKLLQMLMKYKDFLRDLKKGEIYQGYFSILGHITNPLDEEKNSKSQELEKLHCLQRLDIVAALTNDSEHVYSKSFNNAHKEYSGAKTKHFEEYFSEATKLLQEDQK